MAARFRKIDPRLWIDEGFRLLSNNEKLSAVYAITAQSNRIGIFHFSPARAAEDLSVSTETFSKGFSKVVDRLHWRWDSTARVLYIPTWFKYNSPENPNVLKACLGDLHEVPQTGLIAEFSANLRYLPETFHQTFTETFAEGWAKPCPNQEQEQEQEQKQETARAARAKNTEIEDWFRKEFLPQYPKARQGSQIATALIELRKINPSPEEREEMLASLEPLKRTQDWINGFVPGPGNFFKGKLYKNPPTVHPNGNGAHIPDSREVLRLQKEAVS